MMVKLQRSVDIYAQQQVSYFKTCQDNKPVDTQTIGTVLNGFSQGKFKEQIEYLRTLPEDIYKEKKAVLPAYTFTGIFPLRRKDSIESFTSLMPLDFDKVENPSQLRDELKKYPSIYSAFVSPSNKGVKALMVIPKVVNDEEYKSVFKEVQKVFPAIDSACNDLTRLCFACYDPGLWTNPIASAFELPTEYFEVEKTPIVRGYENTSLTPWNDFDERGDLEPLILSHGWKFFHKSGPKTRYTRPGKNHGISGDWHEGLRIFYCQTTNAPPLEKKGYRLNQLHAILNCGGDFAESTRQLYEAGYGERHKIASRVSIMLPEQVQALTPDTLQKIWNEVLITEEPPEEMALISIEGVPVATPSNHSLVLGKKKSRKTLFIVWLVSKFLNQ